MSGVGPKTANTYSLPAPTSYVAGVGRGAMGFTTRSDIGPARMAPAGAPGAPGSDVNALNMAQAPAGYVAGRGRGMGDLARDQGGAAPSSNVKSDGDRGDYSESNYDEFSGYGEKLFHNGAYERDDEEADQIYNQVDDLMESRRKRSREQQMLLMQKQAKNERPRIADQFVDLKRELSSVTDEQWDAIPEVGDHTLKLTQGKKKDKFAYTPVPDYLLAEKSGRLGGPNAASADPSSGMASVFQGGDAASGTQSVFGAGGGLAEARGNALSNKLDTMSDSVTGQTVVDPKGYLTSLNSLKITSSAEIGDIKKARVLLQSVTTTNPKHGPGWIAAARVEEFASKIVGARKIILQGCEQCPENEDVWLEAARLHPVDTGKAILANAVIHLPTSVKLWLYAADIETVEARKKAVLRRSLEFVPNSVKLWKAAIELETVLDARILLARAVECVPHSVEMWLALAKLETHENARKVLNQAREAIPTERATWITAAKLEEAHGNGHLVGRIVEKMIVSLNQYQVIIGRDAWIAEAEECERAEAVLTCAAIVRNTIHLDVFEEDRQKTFVDDAETCLSHTPPSKETARAIYTVALEIFPTKKSLWQLAAMLEKEFGTQESLEAKLKEGVKHCRHAEVLWLMAAKEKWMQGDVSAARSILLEAFNANPKSEQIWLAAAKLEWENNELVRAQLLLNKARDSGASSERVWLKSALLEREMKDHNQEVLLLDEAIRRYPNYPKFYLMAGQTTDTFFKNSVKARNYYLEGLKFSPNCVPLWRMQIRLEERVKGAIRARSTGELARMKLPKMDQIWLECVRVERRSRNVKLAESLLSKGLKDCPSSGALWAEELLTCNKQQRKSKSMDALKKCNNDPIVVVAVARLFEKDNRITKARRWFNRAVALNPKLGDAWVYYYALEYVQTYKKVLLTEKHRVKKLSQADGSNSITGIYNSGSDLVDIENLCATDERVDEDDDLEETDEGGIEIPAVAADSSSNAETGGAGASLLDKDGFKLAVPDKEGVEGRREKKGVSFGGDEAADEGACEGVEGSAAAAAVPDSGVALLQTLERKCAAAQPNTGELWCSMSKEAELRRLPIGDVLRTVAETVLGFSVHRD